jgi:hypothetical protein
VASETKQYFEERTLTDPEHCIHNTQQKMEQLHHWRIHTNNPNFIVSKENTDISDNINVYHSRKTQG